MKLSFEDIIDQRHLHHHLTFWLWPIQCLSNASSDRCIDSGASDSADSQYKLQYIADNTSPKVITTNSLESFWSTFCPRTAKNDIVDATAVNCNGQPAKARSVNRHQPRSPSMMPHGSCDGLSFAWRHRYPIKIHQTHGLITGPFLLPSLFCLLFERP